MFRRRFLLWLSSVVALPASARAVTRFVRRSQRNVPPQAQIRALGDAVLPDELGRGGREVASDAFWRWMSGYREGKELVHPYGSPRISYTGPSPVPKWTAQLTALDRAARANHGAEFSGLDAGKRRDLVREALADVRGERLPNIATASHIALGLLAHFYSSSEANDLCYRAQIGRQKCRPLVHNARKPLPIAAP